MAATRQRRPSDERKERNARMRAYRAKIRRQVRRAQQKGDKR